jgi:hypothetical protein
MFLPIFKDPSQNMMLMQSKWSSILQPVLNLPLNSSVFLQDIVLASGSNVINHKLGRTPQGWIIADQNASASIYRSDAFTATQLTLTSSAAVTINLVVF